MTRRLVLAIIGTTVAALIVAGLGTLLLATISARRTTEHDVRGLSRDLVNSLASLEQPAADTPAARQRRQALVRAVAKSVHIEDVALMTFGPGGRTADALSQWIWYPVKVDGKVAKVQTTMTVKYHLE